MSARKVVTIRKPEFPSGIFDSTSWQSRAQALVASGLIDLAADISALSHRLTDSVMATLDADPTEFDIFIADYRALRSAIWEGIARGIIEQLENNREQLSRGSIQNPLA